MAGALRRLSAAMPTSILLREEIESSVAAPPRLRRLSLFHGLAEIRGESVIVAREPLAHGPLRTFGRLEGRFPVFGGLALVLFPLGLEIHVHGAAPPRVLTHARRL